MDEESLRALEQDLSALRPAAAPETLPRGIAARLDESPLSWGDRVLAGFVGCGALAAAVILTIAVLGAVTAAPPLPQPDAAALAARRQMMQEYAALLAQR
jgi:hypothetical protein